MHDDNERCETCIYWRRPLDRPQAGAGKCRRFPPKANDRKTVRDEWCGEYKADRRDGKGGA